MAKEPKEAEAQGQLTLENDDGEADATQLPTREEIAEIEKASAGKDRKITELTRRIQQLETDANDEDLTAQTTRLTEIVADLKARENELAAREKALNTAITEGIPISLMLRGADDLDAYVQELKGYADQVVQRRTPILGADYGQKPKMTQGHLSRMSATELSKVPTHILDRVLNNGQ